jgi:hypothetical protein
MHARGITFHETMAGSYHLLAAPDRARSITFTIGARSRRLLDFLRNPLTEIEGEIDAEGLARHRLVRGTLELDLLRKRKIVYRFDFRGDDGESYAFSGEKDLRKGPFLEAMTVLPGAILDAGGATVGEALLRFDLRSDLLGFVKNFRVRW